MRRLSGFVVSAVLVTTVIGLAPSAQASGAPDRFAYHSTGLFTSWEERQRISADSYEKTNWSSAATSPEREPTNASGDTSRYEHLCTRRDDGSDRFRCSLVSRMTGIRRDLADVTFSVDNDLGAATLTGAFRLRQVEHKEVVAVKDVRIAVNLAGRGDLYRSKESYTRWDGNCPESRYRFQYRYRRAYASVSMTGDFSVSLEKLKRSSMSDQDGFVLRRQCD